MPLGKTPHRKNASWNKCLLERMPPTYFVTWKRCLLRKKQISIISIQNLFSPQIMSNNAN